ncbi:hypothetical protein B0H14DRAFT_2763117 [Mycena olivaceomarginata]|nr:hypothetical protein B0H14DRAFT_2763117 [Mycena olivaceomarginata]
MLEEHCAERGYKVIFFPKFHPELNFIEQWWGYAKRSSRFADAYFHGLDGADAAWANKKYRGHRALPPQFQEDLRQRKSRR